MEELLSDGATVSMWVNNNSKLSCGGKEKLCIVVSLLLCTFPFKCLLMFAGSDREVTLYNHNEFDWFACIDVSRCGVHTYSCVGTR